jgi:hypothetical protein
VPAPASYRVRLIEVAIAVRVSCETGQWQLADPDATALRLGALYDGSVGLLNAATRSISPAEAHLRKAFSLECGA